MHVNSFYYCVCVRTPPEPTGRGFVLSKQAECCWGVEATLDY